MNTRKCCGTPKGPGPHADGCHQGTPGRARPLPPGSQDKAARVGLLESIAGDWEDGAYWAYAMELGLDVADIVDYHARRGNVSYEDSPGRP